MGSAMFPDDDKEPAWIGYIVIAVIFAFFWVPKYGWVLGIIRSLFWGVFVLFHVFSWLYNLIF